MVTDNDNSWKTIYLWCSIIKNSCEILSYAFFSQLTTQQKIALMQQKLKHIMRRSKTRHPMKSPRFGWIRVATNSFRRFRAAFMNNATNNEKRKKKWDYTAWAVWHENDIGIKCLNVLISGTFINICLKLRKLNVLEIWDWPCKRV